MRQFGVSSALHLRMVLWLKLRALKRIALFCDRHSKHAKNIIIAVPVIIVFFALTRLLELKVLCKSDAMLNVTAGHSEELVSSAKL